MAYPNLSSYNISLTQTSGSSVGGQFPFVERIISGSNLFIVTDGTGNLTGSTSVTASAIYDSGTLTVVGASTFGTVTATSITGSLSGSNISTGNATIVGGTINGTTIGATTTSTGKFTSITASSGIVTTTLSASGAVTASSMNVVNASTFGTVTATAITGALSGSSIATGNATIAGGTINGTTIGATVSSSGIFTTLTATSITGSLSGSNISTGNATIAGGTINGTTIGATTTSTGKFTSITASSGIVTTTLSASGAVTASSINVVNSVVDGGSLTVLGNTTLGDQITDTTIITGSLFQSGSYYTIGSITASGNISASGTISASSINVDTCNVTGQLTVGSGFTTNGSTVLGNGQGNTVLINPATSTTINSPTITLTGSVINFSGSITANSVISASAGITASSINVVNSVVDGGSLTVLGNTVLGNQITDSTTITGSLAQSGSFYTIGSITASGNISASGTVTAGVLNVTGLTTLANVTASSGYFSGNLTVAGTISGSITNASTASAVTITNTPSTAGSYYVTFVDGTTGTRALRTDSNVLTWDPGLDTLNVGSTIYINSGVIESDAVTASVFPNATSIKLGGSTTNVTASNNLQVASTTNGTNFATANALYVAGGATIAKDLWISGSTTIAGNLTILGTGSIVNISSSTVIIGDNRLVLNAGTPMIRYAGLDVFDSGSGTIVNNVTSSFLWDGQNDNWLLVSANNNPVTQSSAIIIGGPSGSFGSEGGLSNNFLPKSQVTGKNITNSKVSDDGTILLYTGTTISGSQISASGNLWVAGVGGNGTGSITYATGVLVTYVTGSFNTLTITTGSSPGVGFAPASANAVGMPGQINVDNNFIYVYTNSSWKRVSLSQWVN